VTASAKGPSLAPANESGRETVKFTKTCRKCGETKPADEFPRQPARRDGLSSWCKACHAEACRAWRDRKRDEHRQAELVVLDKRLADLRESERRRRERQATR